MLVVLRCVDMHFTGKSQETNFPENLKDNIFSENTKKNWFLVGSSPSKTTSQVVGVGLF